MRFESGDVVWRSEKALTRFVKSTFDDMLDIPGNKLSVGDLCYIVSEGMDYIFDGDSWVVRLPGLPSFDGLDVTKDYELKASNEGQGWEAEWSLPVHDQWQEGVI